MTRYRWLWLGATLGALLLAGVAWYQRRVVHKAAEALSSVARVVVALRPALAPSKAVDGAEPPSAQSESPVDFHQQSAQIAQVTPVVRHRPPAGIRVRAPHVLKAIAARARPRGEFAAATTARPAGVRLTNVMPGLGLMVGDVITSVSGQPVTSESEVTDRVLGAIGAGEKTVGGVAWRGPHRMSVTVEIPGR